MSAEFSLQNNIFLLRAVGHLKPIINSIYQQICGKTEMQRNEYFLLQSKTSRQILQMLAENNHMAKKS